MTGSGKENPNLKPSKEAMFELGRAHYTLKNFPLALRFLQEAQKSNPQNEDICLLLAKTYKSTGKFDQALRILLNLKKYSHNGVDIDAELSPIYAEIFNGKAGQDQRAFAQNEKIFAQAIQDYNFEGRYELTRELVPRALRAIADGRVLLKNRLLNELEIAEGKIVISSVPRRLTVTLSNRCNLFCIMCLTSKVKWETPRKIIEEIYSLFPRLEKVMWQGGEVFALDFFEEILSVGFQYPHLRHSIVTNGQLISEEMAERLVTNNVELTVSVDGITKEVYEYIRRGASFETLMRTVKLISELKKKLNPDMVLNLNVAIMKSNYHQLAEFIEFGKEYGFSFICLMPIHIHLKTPEDIFTNRDMQALAFITEISQKIEEKVKQYGLRLENRLPRLTDTEPKDKTENNETAAEENSGKLLCHIPWQQLLIDYDGTVRPDCLCKPEKSAGSLSGNSSLADIWNNEAMQEYREKIIERRCFDLCNPICVSGKICESHLKIP